MAQLPAARLVLPGGQAVGQDVQENMVMRLKKRAALAGLENLSVQVGDAVYPRFSPGSFDLIYLCTVLGKILDQARALEQCFAALRPGGQLSITEIFADPHYQSKATVRRLSENAGFSFDDVHGRWWYFAMNFTRPSSGLQGGIEPLSQKLFDRPQDQSYRIQSQVFCADL